MREPIRMTTDRELLTMVGVCTAILVAVALSRTLRFRTNGVRSLHHRYRVAPSKHVAVQIAETPGSCGEHPCDDRDRRRDCVDDCMGIRQGGALHRQ